MIHDKILEELLKECNKEKLHLCGHVQSFGALLGIQKSSGIITYVSENIEKFLHVSPEKLLGQKLNMFFSSLEKLAINFQNRSSKENFTYQTWLYKKNMFDIKLSNIGEHLLIEFENSFHEDFRSHDRLQLRIEILKAPLSEKEIIPLGDVLLKGIFETTQYDRVMLYQFHEDWSGEVICEIAKEGLGSYLGLRFPASDIPLIARELYLKNPFRHIADTTSQNIPILSLDESTPDLTYSDIRSVSPVHIEYMNNMGIQGSFSTPIVIFGELWGLVTCHNTAPKYIGVVPRNNARILAHSYAISISSFITNEKLQKLDSTDRHLDIIFEKIGENVDVFDGIESFQEPLFALINADGFTIVIDDNLLSIGEVPTQEAIEPFDSWFTKVFGQNTFATDSLHNTVLNDSLIAQSVAGILCIKTKTQSGKSIRCYWFRNELKQEIIWAGNPNKPIIEDAGAMRLSPRRSFEQWIEIKNGYAKAWNRLDMIMVTKLIKSLNKWL